MASFAYTARDSAGRSVNGTLSAASMPEALGMIRAEGKYPVSVRPAGQSEVGGSVPVAAVVTSIKISRAELISLCQQLSIMVDTGVTLSDALDCISRQTESGKLKSLVADLIEQVNAGSSFSAALARHPRSFPRIFIALMGAAEKSGMMAKMLQRAVGYLRDEQETLRKVRGALTYPGIMLAFALTTTVFLLAFVLPKFTAIYANKKAALPMPTQVLMAISNGLVNHWIAILVTLATVVGGWMLYVRTVSGRRVAHYIQLNAPLLGSMFRKMHLARGLRMIGTMAGAGVNLTDSITTAHDLCGNTYFRELWESVQEQIQAGKQLSEPLFRSKLVPRSIAQMIFSGEKSGKLAYVMESVSGYGEQELKEQIANLTRYIEPAMIVVMGIIIGGVAMALLLPIFTISRVKTAH